jgi:hypothetical protein
MWIDSLLSMYVWLDGKEYTHEDGLAWLDAMYQTYRSTTLSLDSFTP